MATEPGQGCHKDQRGGFRGAGRIKVRPPCALGAPLAPRLGADGDGDGLGLLAEDEDQAVEQAVGEVTDGAERGEKVGQGGLRGQGAGQARRVAGCA